ncbi:disease resistance protein (TIR-NBS-LRR class), partial [Trifolium pratense]
SCLAYTGVGPSAPFQVPKDIDCRIEGIVLRVIYSSTSENTAAECLTSVLIVNYTKCTIHIYKRDTIMSFNDEDWKNVTSSLGPGDNVKICVAFEHGLIVKKTIVYLISGQSIIVEIDDANMEANPLHDTVMNMKACEEEEGVHKNAESHVAADINNQLPDYEELGRGKRDKRSSWKLKE